MGVSIFGHEISVKTTDCCHGDTPGSRVPPAVNLFVKVTDGCNARCLFCSNAGAPHTTLPFDTAKLFSVVDELQRNRIIINRFNITGGEPAVVAPLVEELLQELSKAGMTTYMFTLTPTDCCLRRSISCSTLASILSPCRSTTTTASGCQSFMARRSCRRRFALRALT